MLIKSFVHSLIISLFLSLSVQADDSRLIKCVDAWLVDAYSDALVFCMPLAEAGHTFAQLVIAHLYHHGKGVPQDYKEAAKWWNLATEEDKD